MRGRHSAAILRMMGVTETVATTIDEYVAIAARLGQDFAVQACSVLAHGRKQAQNLSRPLPGDCA